ncbi:alginate lyase family protein [Sphingomonas bacterium]|uniref:heparinase II/III family protein n=1 Tax=Sphingomonas bacterium TaxID=1895847 RepID=UPI0026048408|nr:alginate lyase family protein [Sphingomonas bacterium]MDB5677661.1 Heparinase family protein [Sphingomonas bacterium]
MSIARNIAFARHIPLRQIVARFRLEARRRWTLRRPTALLAGAVPAATLPQALLPPRTGMVERTPDGWRFTFIGRTVAMGETIDWRADADQLWRMNLHYMEYLEELQRDAGLALIRQWIAANPPFQPGYWHDAWNSYALSLRVVVWMQRLAAWGIDPADAKDILASLSTQIDFLTRNLETDLGGNHLVKNIKALAWASAFFAAPTSDPWRALASDLLNRELPRQILRDGVHYERSPSYHAQVFADLIETRAALGFGAATVTLDKASQRMAAAAALLAHPDGRPAQFNDAGLSMAYSPAQCLAAYAKVTGQPIPKADGAFRLPSAGYFGLHAPGFALIADMGAIGPDSLPAHAHGDIGSIELSVGGHRFIVDQGVFEYVAGDKRRASRSAHTHNCLAIEGVEPADFFGAFRCGRRPKVTVMQYVGGEDTMLLRGHHDGYRHLRGCPEVERRVEVNAGGIALHDRIQCGTWHAATSRLLLHPDCSVELYGDTAVVSRSGIALAVRGSAPLRVEDAVWWPDMGVEVATKRICLTLPADCFEAKLEIGAAEIA